MDSSVDFKDQKESCHIETHSLFHGLTYFPVTNTELYFHIHIHAASTYSLMRDLIRKNSQQPS